MRTRTAIVALIALPTLLAACGGSNSVGSGVNLNNKGGGGALSLGSTTTTSGGGAAPTTTRPVATTEAPAVTRAPATTAPPTTAPQAQTFTITIESDTSGQPPFNPPDAAVYAGTPVKWVNADSKPHTVTANDGAFSSPSIAPGASFTWVANSVGKHNYADGTRPYAVGTLEVAAR
ncbi:MAG TPA: hypothetical protein VE990_17455 [Acidimicrobiales bacterium]|nr:hypothetical protein [Acidimicrobiales bacterium]